MKIRHPSLTNKGFTLFEIVLAMGILTMLSGSIIAISKSTLILTTNLVDEQRKQIHRDKLEAYIRACYAQCSRDSQFTLRMNEQTNLQTLTLKNPNQSFPLDGKDTLSQESTILAQFNSSGLIRLSQIHFASSSKNNQIEDKPSAKTLLLDQMTQVEWEFYNQSTKEWLTYWQPSMGKPVQVRFHYMTENEDITQTISIWLPPNS